jgi:hypothetical protein
LVWRLEGTYFENVPVMWCAPRVEHPQPEPEYDREARSADAGNHLRYGDEAHVSFTSYPAGASTELPI